ncbi:unnamed protein product [Diatraea saccharalis]|uniref:Uncharacterized protein n=1 Tax=Diatraea saccharalis TaxID=40085 RepID=A0A9N9RGU9_9NEOP|nr:unnamed protein product [Diatraea saccharalis]
MNVVRSPGKEICGSSHAGSLTDLSKCDSSPLTLDTLVNTRKNKRKLPDSDTELRHELMDFRNEMMGFLREFRKSHDEDMNRIRDNVSEIKNQVYSIKTITDSIIVEHNINKTKLDTLSASMEFHSKEQDDIKISFGKISSEIRHLLNM